MSLWKRIEGMIDQVVRVEEKEGYSGGGGRGTRCGLGVVMMIVLA